MSDDAEVRIVERPCKPVQPPKGPRTPYEIVPVKAFHRYAVFHGSTAVDAPEPVLLGTYPTEQAADIAARKFVEAGVAAGKPKPRYKLALPQEDTG